MAAAQDWLELVALGGSGLVQDSGRGHRSSGVPGSGAYDRFAHSAATALVGGSHRDAVLEVVGALTLLVSRPALLVVAGPADVRIGGRAVPTWTVLDLPVGVPLELHAPRRATVAVAGGVLAPATLGSRATCLLGPIGPEPLQPGDRLAIGGDPGTSGAGDWCRPPTPGSAVRVIPGPHPGFVAGTGRVLDVSRMGVRIRPPAPAPAAVSLPSLGVLPGAIQVLPMGDWIVLGPDAGTMGGYPVAGVVCTADLDRFAHLLPGDGLELVATTVEQAPRPPTPEVVRLAGLGG